MLFLTNFVAPTAPAFTPASKQYNPTALDWVAPEVPDFIPQSYNNISTAVSVKFLDVFFLFLNYVLLLQLSLFFFFLARRNKFTDLSEMISNTNKLTKKNNLLKKANHKNRQTRKNNRHPIGEGTCNDMGT